MNPKILFNILCISLCMLLVVAQNGNYKVNVRRLNTISNPLPAINSQLSGDSVMKWNYNCAYVPIYGKNTTLETPSLIVRTQNQANQSEQYSTTPSKLVFTTMRQNNFEGEISFTSINENSIVFEPNSPLDNFGTEDPRVAYDPENQLYYMTYSAVQSYENGTVISRLALATTHTPWLKNSWERRGVLFPQLSWSKSGSMLIRKTGKNYMIFGDSSLVPGVQLAVSNDLLRWDLQPGIFIQTRNNSFDSYLIEGGPPPVLLSNGNYFYIYNSARSGYPSPKPGYDLQYNLGFVILDGNDPTKILFRSDQPILSPETAWEKGSSPFLGLTPNVVFCSAMSTSPKADTFHIYYGAADSVVGVAEVTVSF